MATMSQTLSIGIDLGTTNTCLSFWKDGRAFVLVNKFNKKTTPSCVGFGAEGYVTGFDAVRQHAVNPSNTIFEAKRLIGKNYKTATRYTNYCPFLVVDDGKNYPQYEVNYQNEVKRLYPEQISGLIFKKNEGRS